MDPEVYYNPEQQQKKNFTLKKPEIIHLVIAWVGITVAFSWKGVSNIGAMWDLLPIILVGTLTAFILHELAHKFVAIHYGCYARFVLWPAGLGFAIILSLITSGGFVFAAPGAVYIWGKNITRKENGIISFSGPFANFCLSIIFIFLGIVLSQFVSNQYLLTLFYYVAMINIFLGAFNLLPIPPLDGFKVFLWNKLLWLISLLAFIGLYFFLIYV
ncbi:MAG: site-2 protease family protein [Candidatus Diapherotrites archaeon CG08_land_8_20_14_0_20_30_16]|nr:MAG: site-2 protease family protein [Candidatus Diapherotrites archaeon CG08_land_8_20_14_0_20_30_16]